MCVLALPDLRVDEELLKSTLAIDVISNRDPCLIDEGCLLAAHPRDGALIDDRLEHRRLIRFATKIWNDGPDDLIIGHPPFREGVIPPADASWPDMWEFSGCHRHFHLAGYARHELLFAANLSRIERISGEKTGFCLRDSVCLPGSRTRYTCSHQGIGAGCADVYRASLPCQWLDITDIGPVASDEPLLLRVTVNAQRTLAETSFDNNVAEVAFTLGALPAFTGGGDPIQRATIALGFVAISSCLIVIAVGLCVYSR